MKHTFKCLQKWNPYNWCYCWYWNLRNFRSIVL